MLGFVVLGGCGGDSKGVVMLTGPNTPYTPGTPTATDAGVDASASASSTTGPLVTLMSLTPTRDPIAGPVLTGASVDVQCQVKPRSTAAPVDPSKVSVAVFSVSGGAAVATVPAMLQGTDTYGASVPLDKVPTGAVRFRCSGVDKGSMPLTGWQDVYSFYDAGPVIMFTNLNEMSVVARGNDPAIDMAVQFTVTPSRLSELDPGADVGDVQLSISERAVDLAPPMGNAYAKEIDFLSFFAGAPVESVTVAVSATNKRGGSAATAKKQIIVKVDGKGPNITVTAPPLSGGQPPIVGGTVGLTMTITDDLAGVAMGSDKLFAEILYQGINKNYPLTSLGNNNYSFTFEASQFSETSNIVAKIHAVDKAGNDSVAPFAMRLDTVPPWVSLDPANVRVLSGTNPTTYCSASFDPLGSSPQDGEVVDKNSRFRAMVWERGIELPGATEIWVAGVRNDSVTFYAQNNPDVPLIINQAGDKTGTCDAINFLGASAPFVFSLAPVTTGGGAPLSSMDELSRYAPLFTGCSPLTGTAPGPKCDGSEMTYVIAHAMAGHPPVIYGATPTSAGLGCTGTSFDIAGQSGWTCVAVAARDLTGATGNLGVSSPIRVCRKIKDTDCEGMIAGGRLKPPVGMTCTDGCKMPDIWTAQPAGTQVLRQD